MILKFLKDVDGLSAIENSIIISTVGAAIGVSAWFFGGMISSMLYSLGDCLALNFDPACYSIHLNDFEGFGENPSWWPHE